MEAVKISPKFQVVIPKKLRDALKLSPGQKVQMVIYGNRIEMIPLRKISDMADSIILATARVYGATIWTQDSDFKEFDGVQYIAKTNG